MKAETVITSYIYRTIIPNSQCRYNGAANDHKRQQICGGIPRSIHQMTDGLSNVRSKVERITRLLVDKAVPFFGIPEALFSNRMTN